MVRMLKSPAAVIVQFALITVTAILAFCFASAAKNSTLRYACTSTCAMQPSRITTSFPAPAFSVETLDNTSFHIDHQRNKTVLLVFWSTQCPACDQLLPTIAKAFKQLQHNPRIALLTIASDSSKSAVTALLERTTGSDNPFPVALDPSQHITQTLYQIQSLPTTWLIDPEKNARMRIDGPRNWHSPVALSLLELTSRKIYCPVDETSVDPMPLLTTLCDSL